MMGKNGSIQDFRLVINHGGGGWGVMVLIIPTYSFLSCFSARTKGLSITLVVDFSAPGYRIDHEVAEFIN